MELSLDNYFDELELINKNELNKNNEFCNNNNECCNDNINFIKDNGIIICKVCNNIISNILDTPEWKNYKNNSQNQTRCGMPSSILLPNSSLGTTISNNYYGGDQMKKINMYQNWNSMPYKERSLYKVFIEIENKCKLNNLPEIIITTAKTFYKMISNIKISRGSNRIGIIAASVFYACKECNVPRSTKEIAYYFSIDTLAFLTYFLLCLFHSGISFHIHHIYYLLYLDEVIQDCPIHYLIPIRHIYPNLQQVLDIYRHHRRKLHHICVSILLLYISIP